MAGTSPEKRTEAKPPFRLHWGHVFLYGACLWSTAVVCTAAYFVVMMFPQFFAACGVAAVTSTAMVFAAIASNSG